MLGRREVSELLTADECIDAVEDAFRQYGEGRTAPPAILGLHSTGGGFHIKAGLMEFEGRPFFVAKSNGNFPTNRKRNLPTIQGVVIVCDGADGRVLALLDSIEITILRTGAATAVGAKYLSRPDAKIMTIAGAGEQGRISIEMISRVRPLEKVFIYDIDGERSRALAAATRDKGIEVSAIDDLLWGTHQSDIIVTCTPSHEFFLKRDHVSLGAFIAAVGSDSEDKHEIDPALLAEATLVTDITEQCATIGELHHALDAGLIGPDAVHTELGEIVADRKPGRTADDELIIFDSTGMGLQDVAAAVRVYRKAEGLSDRARFVF